MNLNLEQANRLINQNKVIAIPTDTVYGLAAKWDSEFAVDKLYRFKRRPYEKPLITLLPSKESLYPLLSKQIPTLESLISSFWPGALTLVVPVNCDKVPSFIRSGKASAGFRVPNHAETLQLLSKTGPLVASSANLSTQMPCTIKNQLTDSFGKEFPILENKGSSLKLESTILIYREGRWRCARVGAVNLADIEAKLDFPLEI